MNKCVFLKMCTSDSITVQLTGNVYELKLEILKPNLVIGGHMKKYFWPKTLTVLQLNKFAEIATLIYISVLHYMWTERYKKFPWRILKSSTFEFLECWKSRSYWQLSAEIRTWKCKEVDVVETDLQVSYGLINNCK